MLAVAASGLNICFENQLRGSSFMATCSFDNSRMMSLWPSESF